MLKSQYFGGNGQKAQDVPTERIDSRLKDTDGGGVLWLDIDEPTEQDFEMLASEFGFHPLAIEDLKQRDQRPKVVEYGDYVFVVCHEWRPAPDREDLSKQCVERSAEVHAFVGLNYVVTVHTGDSDALRTARKRWETNLSDNRKRNTRRPERSTTRKKQRSLPKRALASMTSW